MKSDESEPNPKTVERHLSDMWLKELPWLTNDQDKNVINCSLYLKMGTGSA